MRFPLYFFPFILERSNCHRFGWLVCMLGARSFRVFLLLTTATEIQFQCVSCSVAATGTRHGHSESKCICALNLLLFSALFSRCVLLAALFAHLSKHRRDAHSAKIRGKKCMTTTRSFGCLDALCIRLALETFKFRCFPKAQYTIASIVIF